MKTFKVAAVAIAFAFASFPASAAVIMNYSGTTGYDCTASGQCYAFAQADFKLPTYDYVGPVFNIGPLPGAPTPQRFTYRVVLSTPGQAFESVSKSYSDSYWIDYVFENGQFKPIGGNENLFWGIFESCYIESFCEPDGYAQGNQSIFQFGDGFINTTAEIASPQEADTGTVIIAFRGGVSAAAYLDPSQAGLPFTAQLFQFGAVPEPSTWVMLILGFGFCGARLRRRRRSTTHSHQA